MTRACRGCRCSRALVSSSSTSPTTPWSSAHPRRWSRSRTSRRRSSTRSASRWRDRRSRRRPRETGGRRSSSSRPPFPFRARRGTRARLQPPPRSASLRPSASRRSARRSSLPAPSRAARDGRSSSCSSRPSSRAGSTGGSSCTTPRAPTSSTSATKGASLSVPTRHSSTPTSSLRSPRPRRCYTAGRLPSSPPAAPRRFGRPGRTRCSRRPPPRAGAWRSHALNNPVAAGALHGYPHDPDALERVLRLPGRRLFSALPGAIQRRVLQRIPRQLTATAAFAGRPSVAHAEALLRAVEARSAELERPLDTVVLGIPRATYHLPREAPNPLLVAGLGLGLALRLWRDSSPIADGGTLILVHPFRRRFPHPTQVPYRALFGAFRTGVREPDELADAERAAAADPRAIAAYRDGRSCHPLLPFVDWSGCAPALSRLGAVLVAGCRDATAARLLLRPDPRDR